MNENYAHPAMPEGAEEGILRGMYLLREAPRRRRRVSAARLGHDPARGDGGRRAARGGLRGRGRRVERDVLHRAAPRRARGRALEPAASDGSRARPYVERALAGRSGPSSRRPTTSARSPTRSARTSPAATRARHRRLRPQRLPRRAAQFFEVDRHHVAVAALKALADEGAVEPSVVASAIERYAIEADAAAPWTR